MRFATIFLTGEVGEHDVVDAWRHSARGRRVAALIAVLAAVAATSSVRVPVASGLTSAVLVAAALVDVHERRLPNRIIGLGLAAFVILGFAELITSHQLSVRSVTLGAIAFALPLILVHLCSPASLGFGDVKLSAVLGATLGAVDWRLALWALAVASAMSATVALVRRTSTFAFGPGLVGATIILLVLVAAQPNALQVAGTRAEITSCAQ